MEVFILNCIICTHLRAGYEAFKKILISNYFNKIILFTYSLKENNCLIDLAKKNNITIYLEPINSYVELVKSFKPQFLFSIYYRHIISASILSNVQKTAINLHPSLLPKHKGAFSAPWAILDGDKFSGITYHEMTEKIDEGKIVLQKRIKISNKDTAYSLYNKLVDLGIKNFDEMINKVLINNYKGRKQKGLGSYHYRKVPYNGEINLNWDLSFIDKFIRAMYFPPHKGAILKFNGKEYEFLNLNSFLIFCKKNIKGFD